MFEETKKPSIKVSCRPNIVSAIDDLCEERKKAEILAEEIKKSNREIAILLKKLDDSSIVNSI